MSSQRMTTTADLLSDLPASFSGQTVQLRELLSALGDRGMASALLLTTLPQLLPIPLGFSNLLTLPIILVAAQMITGRQSPWLPRWVMDRPIQWRRLDAACARVVPPLRRVERLICPRLGIVRSAWGNRLIGIGCLAFALVCLAPLPLTGWLPAGALFVIGVGMLEGDGLVMLLGLALGVVAVAVFLAVVTGLVELG